MRKGFGLVVCAATALACAGEHAAQKTSSAADEWCAAKQLPTSEGEHGVAGAFAELNKQFLQTHVRARARTCESLDAQRLVIRYAFGTLEARWRGEVVYSSFVLPNDYHPVKDVSHAVLLAALLFADPQGSARAGAAVRTMDAVLVAMRTPQSGTAALIPAALLPAQRRILTRTRDALDAFARGELDRAGQERYFASVHDDLTENLRSISAQVVRGLHEGMQTIRSRVSANAWSSFVVVAAVAHQARAREIGVQYFERLLQEPVGEGARNERRLVVAEALFAGPDQYGLLSAHLVDQAAGTAIFADPQRLQWDVLGDDGGALDSVLPR
jgi:hypothetical protein